MPWNWKVLNPIFSNCNSHSLECTYIVYTCPQKHNNNSDCVTHLMELVCFLLLPVPNLTKSMIHTIAVTTYTITCTHSRRIFRQIPKRTRPNSLWFCTQNDVFVGSPHLGNPTSVGSFDFNGIRIGLCTTFLRGFLS